MKKGFAGPVVRILLTIGIMGLVVWSVGNKLRAPEGRAPAPVPAVLAEDGILSHGTAEAKHFEPLNLATPLLAEPAPGVKVRDLETYYARRAYHGAPPVVPHEVDAETSRRQACNVCHEKGGFVAKFNAYTPVTPHPEFSNCLQCHVEESDEEPFRFAGWMSPRPPKIKRPALPGGPPALPHPLMLHEKCLACHAGPAVPEKIRTSHPERIHCLQCHVPQEDVMAFSRPGYGDAEK
jgi:cytochrome c-type protein NapB